MKNIAVILAGCGNKDGAEITEAVSALISLSQEGANYEIFAPNISFSSLNFLNDEKDEERNVLKESARIARGQISNMSHLKESEFDALLLPGGHGVATNLCNWAQKGAICTVNPDVEKTVTEFYESGKPIGAVCIAPVILAKVLGKHGITVTIGNNKEVAQEIEKTGAMHEECPVDDYVSDRNHKILTTPAYMYGHSKPHEVFTGISKLVKELVEMA